MRLVSYEGGFGRLVDDDTVVPMGEDIVAHLAGRAPASDADPVAAASLRMLAPVPRPSKVVCVGLNYLDHAREAGKPVPEEPILFGKWANSVVGHDAVVCVPPMAQDEKIDYEGELGVVIGRRASRVDPEQAWDHVAGYTVMNDLSSRGLQWRLKQWTRGKAIDGFLPMGPCLVTPDEVDDPHDLAIRTVLNGEVVQDSSTSQLIFGVHELVSSISQTITLEPGDCIATGTPPGVGFSWDPPKFLTAGDEIVVEVDGIGRLVTRIG